MLAQVVWCARLAMVGKVSRRGTGDEVHLADASRDERRDAQHADAQGNIDAVRNEIDDAIVETEVEFDQRIAAREFRQRRQQQVTAECDGDIDPELALRPRSRIAQCFLGIAQVVEDAAAAGQELGAFRGQADAARRPVQQPHAEVLFERGDVLAGRGARQLQLVGRPRE